MTTLKHHERTAVILSALGLSATQKAILLALSHRTNQNGEAWPGQPLLAAEAGLSVRGLRKALAGLGSVMEIDTESRRSTVYRIRWDALSLLAATPERSSSLNASSEEQSAATPERSSSPPRNVVPPTPERSSPERYKNGSEERYKNEAPPTPQGAECGSVDSVDGSIEQDLIKKACEKKPTRKRSRSSLTLEEVAAIPMPLDLQALDGYTEAFARWCEVRKGTSWRKKADQIERFHLKMSKAASAGLDVLGGLERAYESGWQGLNPSYLKPLAEKTTGTAPKGADLGAWSLVADALAHFGARPPYQETATESAWSFDDDPTVCAAYDAGLLAAAEARTVPEAWQTLYRNGGDKARLWQSRRFARAFHAAQRGALRGAA